MTPHLPTVVSQVGAQGPPLGMNEVPGRPSGERDGGAALPRKSAKEAVTCHDKGRHRTSTEKEV